MDQSTDTLVHINAPQTPSKSAPSLIAHFCLDSRSKQRLQHRGDASLCHCRLGLESESGQCHAKTGERLSDKAKAKRLRNVPIDVDLNVKCAN